MKKFLLVLVAFVCFGISAEARKPDNGKYCSTDNSYVIVDGYSIYLYIDGYSAGKFTIKSGGDTDDPDSMWFQFTDASGKEYDGEYKKINGEYILKMGSRTLKKSNC